MKLDIYDWLGKVSIELVWRLDLNWPPSLQQRRYSIAIPWNNNNNNQEKQRTNDNDKLEEGENNAGNFLFRISIFYTISRQKLYTPKFVQIWSKLESPNSAHFVKQKLFGIYSIIALIEQFRGEFPTTNIRVSI